MANVKIKQFKNKAKEPVAGLTPEHAIYDKNGVRLDAKLGNINLQEFRDLQQQCVNNIKQQQDTTETYINNKVVSAKAEIDAKHEEVAQLTQASMIGSNATGLEGSNVEENLTDVGSKLTELEEFSGKKYKLEKDIVAEIGKNKNEIVSFNVKKGEKYVINISANDHVSYASIVTADNNWNKVFKISNIYEVNGSDIITTALIDATQIRLACLKDGVITSGNVLFKIREYNSSIYDIIKESQENTSKTINLLIGLPLYDSSLIISQINTHITSLFNNDGEYSVLLQWNNSDIVNVRLAVRLADGNYSYYHVKNGFDCKIPVISGKEVIIVSDFTTGVSSTTMHITISMYGINQKVEDLEVMHYGKGEILFGACYFGAWRGISGYGPDSNKDHRSYLAYKSSNIYNPNKPWVDVYHDMYGEYPTGPVSFSMAFAGKDVNYKIEGEPPVNLKDKKSRIPIKFPMLSKQQFQVATDAEKYSWTIDSVEAMESQIELAYAHGIDYFEFCFYPETEEWGVPIFDENDNFIDNYDSILRNNSLNKSIFDYLKCKNRYKVKMVICLESQDPIDYSSGTSILVFDNKPVRQQKILKYIYDTFIRDNESYLFIDGMPLVALFNNDKQFNELCVLKMFNNTYALNTNVVNNTYGKMAWGTPTQKRQGESTFKELSDYALSRLELYRSYAMNLYPATVGWDRQQLLDFMSYNPEANNHVGYAISPTKEEIKNEIINLVSQVKRKSRNVLVSIYAWDELGEGGFLLPTKGDGLNETGDYYNLSKLEAIKEAKIQIKS